ncbi:MAG: DUF4105 domain-containing protein [Akkermansiaceae bacterium]
MIFYSGPFAIAGWGNGTLATLWLAVMVVVFFLVKSWKQRAVWWGAFLLMVLVPYFSIQPSDEREWSPEFSRVGYASVSEDHVTLHYTRVFNYRTETDFDARWESRAYTLSKLQGVDYIQSNFHGDLMAHPLLSFDFGDEGRICLSVESRREQGEEFSPFGGLYKIYELQYIFSTEEDIVFLRSHIRKETVRRYTLNAKPSQIREVFLASVKAQNALAETPKFYNVLRTNCTTSLRVLQPKEQRIPWDLRLLFNGRLDSYLYEENFILTEGLPFEELREKALVLP